MVFRFSNLKPQEDQNELCTQEHESSRKKWLVGFEGASPQNVKRALALCNQRARPESTVGRKRMESSIGCTGFGDLDKRQEVEFMERF